VLDENALVADAPPLPDEVADVLQKSNAIPDHVLDRVYRLEHRVPVGPGRKIAVTETFTLRSWLRWPHRAMMMVPSQGSNRSAYNVPIEGYDGGAIMAREGFFAFTVDPPGTGDSYYPDHGLTVTYEYETEVLSHVAQYIRLTRAVPRIDAFGEEIGGGVASHLCADQTRFRSCVMVSMLYKTGSEFFNQIAPFFEAFLLSSPDGYFISFPESYFNVLLGASPDVSEWYLSTQLGRYAAGTFKQDFDRMFSGGPSYNPTHAAVPGLIIRGEFDPNNYIEDIQELASDYGSVGGGGPAEIAVIPGGTHIVRLDAAPIGPQVWDLTKEFVSRP
jgi:pimeloyl-ACP methyl ester carboxylesterase